MVLCTACLGADVLPTQDADDLYNGLRKTDQVAFHKSYWQRRERRVSGLERSQSIP